MVITLNSLTDFHHNLEVHFLNKDYFNTNLSCFELFFEEFDHLVSIHGVSDKDKVNSMQLFLIRWQVAFQLFLMQFPPNNYRSLKAAVIEMHTNPNKDLIWEDLFVNCSQ